jgi:hypothetical protein
MTTVSDEPLTPDRQTTMRPTVTSPPMPPVAPST